MIAYWTVTILNCSRDAVGGVSDLVHGKAILVAWPPGGLHPDDVINAVDGKRVKTPMELAMSFPLVPQVTRCGWATCYTVHGRQRRSSC
jgi:hypothetical protein